MIGGSLRGRKLVAPRGEEVRPTADRVREALFNILGGSVEGAVFLDLFAGSGAIGIEAVSRGAARVVLVESGRTALAALERNLRILAAEGPAILVRSPWPRALAVQALRTEAPFTIVFADPPWEDAPFPSILESLSAPGVTAEDARVILEHEARTGAPERGGRFERVRVATYGRAGLAFYTPLSGRVASFPAGN